jgi:FAD/FMN-containing dehydrogenase
VSRLSPALEAELRAALGDDGLSLDEHDLAHYGTDRCRGGWPVAPAAVARPRNVTAVQAVVRACARAAVPIVPSGGRTGLAGGATATAGELVLSLERMRRILEVDAIAGWLRCEAGATVQAVRDAAAAVELLYPIDFASKGSAQIGGSIATNAGGVNVLRYGMTRQWVMGLRVVLASGEILDVGGPLVKNNTGYDLRQLFVGSEGTLGVVVEAVLALTRPPAGRIVALAGTSDEAAIVRLFARVRASGLVCSAFECFDAASVRHVLAHRGQTGRGPLAAAAQHVLVEFELAHEDQGEAALERLTDLFAAAETDGDVADVAVARTPAQQTALWAWREEISESLHGRDPHKADVALPISVVPDFVRRWRAALEEHLPEVEAVCFGHIGDGNLHLNLLRPAAWPLDRFVARCAEFDESVYALVEELGGSISAEHGIGLLKRAHVHHTRSAVDLEVMRRVKHALDPSGLFNPGKLFPPPPPRVPGA